MTVIDDAAVDLLANMLRVPSLCGAEDELAELLCAAIEDAGFGARRDEAGNVIGAFGSSDAPRSVVILGHMDTVPGRIPVELHDGRLYGRGAVDAKGPLAAAVVAAARASSQPDVDLRITVVGAVQEEGPSVGARHLAGSPSPDFLVIAEPSGWDAVVLGYKGSLRFTATVEQPSSHTAGREPSAPERAVDHWNRLVAWCDARSGEAAGEFNRLTPTLIAMDSTDDGLLSRAELRIGLRLPPGITIDDCVSGVRELLPDGGLDFGTGEEAVRAPKSGPLVASFLRAIREESGTPRFKLKSGTSDMNVVGPVWRCPMLAYGPGDSNLDHTPDEHIKVEEYLRAIRILTHVLEGL